MNVKPLLILCLFLILTMGISRANVYGSTFFLHIGNSASLGFQSQTDRQVLISVTSGAINCSNASLSMDLNHGKIVFMNNESVTFTTSFNVTRLQINYVLVETEVSTSETQNDITVIEWWITIEPWLPITFIFGMIGLVCMFVAPLWCIQLLKKKEYRWAFVQLVSIGAIGVGLVLAWLWGA